MSEENPKQPKIIGVNKIAEFLKFVEFIALPAFLRKEVFGYVTETEFTQAFNLSRDTVVEWKKKDVFWGRVEKQSKDWGKSKMSEVLASMYKKILSEGSAKEVKLWLQYFGGWSEKRELEVKGKVKKELSEEDKALLKKAIEYGGFKSNTGENNK